MRRITLLSLMMISLLVLSACGVLNQGSTNRPIDIPEVRKGTKGVVAEFLANSPPSETTDGVPIAVRFSLHNQGAAEVINGLYAVEVSRGGNRISLDTPTDGFFDVRGKSQSDPIGEKQFFSVNAFVDELPARTETAPAELAVNYCFVYKTIASAAVCVDPDIGGQTLTQKICNEGKVSTSGGQGGPITIESVHLKSIPVDEFIVRPQITIELANKGGGEVMDSSQYQGLCREEVAVPSKVNQVEFAARLSEQPLRCLPSPVVFKDHKAKVTCWLDAGIEKQIGNFKAVFRAEMSYGYHDRVTKSVQITKITP
jgi:hypothetical protein